MLSRLWLKDFQNKPWISNKAKINDEIDQLLCLNKVLKRIKEINNACYMVFLQYIAELLSNLMCFVSDDAASNTSGIWSPQKKLTPCNQYRGLQPRLR